MKLYIDSDPFLKYRPFYEQTQSSNIFLNHWHEVAASALFYLALMLVAPTINTFMFGENYTKITKKKLKINFDIHVVAMVQSVTSVILCIPMFFHPMLKENPVMGTYDFAAFVAAFTSGYFIWDLFYCCVLYFDLFGFQFLFHAVAALVVFLSTFYPFCAPIIPFFLIFELSTPFVNANWFFSKLPAGAVHDKLFVINGLLLISTFFFSRILWGLYAAVKVFVMCWKVKDEVPKIMIGYIFSLNVGLDILNIFWFSKMIRIAFKKFSPSKPVKPNKEELVTEKQTKKEQ
ncbi:unnamed protein product [Ambrosiozyma monospora]|uniref:Unnamed protein product n=1 Tax=Ambrosiozyma monospora TaxID=43982 RepID=A0A9W7DFE4_AMBMO|nr:unnamed protein product [Ambrosiozyma monospora]